MEKRLRTRLQNIQSVIFLRRPSQEANLKDANGLCASSLGIPIAALGWPYTRGDPRIMCGMLPIRESLSASFLVQPTFSSIDARFLESRDSSISEAFMIIATR